MHSTGVDDKQCTNLYRNSKRMHFVNDWIINCNNLFLSSKLELN